jgi:tetratricopeptide (TPR) repeat protein
MRVFKRFFTVATCLAALARPGAAQNAPIAGAQTAYEQGDYKKAIELLQSAANKEPGNGEIQLLLTKSFLETNQYDAAVNSAEKAVASNPKSSVYHQWLGEAYGAKADNASMFSAYSWARKTQKEFETAVQLDERNFDAAQDLIEYDCTAPSVVGGGTDKAQPLIQKLMSLDAAEGHYGAGVCKAVKKDLTTADEEYAKALESKPRSVERIYDIGDYFAQRSNGDKLLAVADAGEAKAPQDPRGQYYRAVGLTLQGEKLPEAEKMLREYLGMAPAKSSYPRTWEVHYWLGRLYEAQKNSAVARTEYETSLKLNPKYKRSQEALKQLGSH